MLKNYFKIALRNIRKNIIFSTISVIGLGIGLTSCILIFEYVSNELSYDKFHASYENIYRIKKEIKQEGNPKVESATTFSRVAYELKETIPGIEEVTRINKASGNIIVEYDENIFREDNVIGTDPSFFSIFDFEFLYGSPETALQERNSVLITEKTASKYFGSENPMGKELIIDGALGIYTSQGYEDRFNFVVSGVVKDLPQNTHLNFDLVVSYNFFANPEQALNNWGDAFYTYLKVEENVDTETITSGLEGIVSKYKADSGITLSLQEMQSIHLQSNLIDEFKPNGNQYIVWLLGGVALLILLIAGANYINFAIAQLVNRQKEMGIRKIYWAQKSHLFSQVFLEAFILNCIALFITLFFIEATNSMVLDLLGFSLSDKLNDRGFIAIIIAILALGTFISGIYPALIIANMKLKGIVQKSIDNKLKQTRTKRLLITFQFTISILVIGCGIILFSQMNFMKQKDLGINIENTIVINGPSVNTGNDQEYTQRIENFKDEVSKLSSIQEVSLANFIPGKEIRGRASGYVRKVGDDQSLADNYYFSQVDYEFFENFELELLSGRSFDPDYITDDRTVIINKKASELLGFQSPDDAVGKKIIYRVNSTPTIVGVVDDFHQYSLNRNFQPIIFEASSGPKGYYYLKLNDNFSNYDIAQVTELWNQIFPGNPFNYFFLDEFYERQYRRDTRFSNAISVFSFLAVFVAAIGFFGLMYYTATQRLKELSIRKIFGARHNDIFSVLAKDLSQSFIIATLIGVPMIYYIASNWLLNYAFKIEITVWMLATPVIILLFITLLIITYQTIRSYQLNSIQALREE
jgi:putative ABC transport system permease protein